MPFPVPIKKLEASGILIDSGTVKILGEPVTVRNWNTVLKMAA